MEEVSTNQERVKFLTEHYDLSTNNAKALLLAEMGFSHSGIAKHLGVTSSTAKGYLRNLESEIGPEVTQTVPKPVNYATHPGDIIKEPEYAGDFIDYEPEFKERQKPLNRGKNIEDIDPELITIKTE